MNSHRNNDLYSKTTILNINTYYLNVLCIQEFKYIYILFVIVVEYSSSNKISLVKL